MTAALAVLNTLDIREHARRSRICKLANSALTSSMWPNTASLAGVLGSMAALARVPQCGNCLLHALAPKHA